MSASRGPSIASHKSKPEGDVLEAFKVFDEKGSFFLNKKKVVFCSKACFFFVVVLAKGKGYLTTAELKKVLQMGGVIEEHEVYMPKPLIFNLFAA